MKLMTKKEWAKMSADAQVQHLLDAPLEYQSMMVPGTKIMQHQAVMGGVLMSGWYPKASDAAREALENTANFVQQLNCGLI